MFFESGVLEQGNIKNMQGREAPEDQGWEPLVEMKCRTATGYKNLLGIKNKIGLHVVKLNRPSL